MPDSGEIPALPPLPSGVLAGKVPKWRLERLVHRACPVCEVDAPDTICQRPDFLTVARCKICRMIYLPEIPPEEEIEAFYRKYGDYKEFLPGRRSRLRKILPIRSQDPFVELLEHSGGLMGRRLCEVGCSYGSFLSCARERGADVIGVELDEGALEHLRRIGVRASKTFYTESKFDVVCAFQLIEHLANPSQFVGQAGQALETDGRLLLALPNGGEAEKVGPAWVGYRVDLEHLNYFSVASLSRLLSRHDLYVEQFWEYFQPNVTRRAESSLARTGWRRKMTDLLCKLQYEPCASSGTFVLCVLARKTAA